ncbi:MAG: hypothetical protein ACXAAT_20585 [Candidatus Hodarchaeales archaeon]|jgi:hypothetical protein
MNKVNLEKLQDTLKMLINLELTMGEFYKTCFTTWPEDENFWKGIGEQELQHAKYLQKMSDMISTSPDKFVIGRTFNPLAINTVVSGIKKNIELIKSNALTKVKTLYLARDMEESALESRLDEIVKTEDLGFLEFARKIHLQTQKHKNSFNDKISELNPKTLP